MYLSRVELDPTRRSTMAALAAPQKLHGAVESAFAGERRRRLWRLDRLGERLYLLLLSEDAPELSGVVEQFGTGAAAETRSYDPLLQTIQPPQPAAALPRKGAFHCAVQFLRCRQCSHGAAAGGIELYP